MSKKILAFVLVMMFLFTACACGAVEIPASDPDPVPESKPTPNYEMPQIVIGDKEDHHEEDNNSEEPVEELTLSDDIWDFTFEIDGIVHQFPCYLNEFTDLGWEPAYDISDDTVGSDNTTLVSFKKDDKTLRLVLYNGSQDVRSAWECTVAGITADKGEEYADVYMAGGIHVNNVTSDSVISYLGEPAYVSDTDGAKYPDSYTYRSDIDRNLYYRFRFDNSTGELDYAWIQNCISMGEYDESTVNEEYPELFYSYREPTAPSDDFFSGVVQFGGDLYRLPVPLEKVLENGWEIKEKTVDTIAAGRREDECITLVRGGEEITLSLTNVTDKLTYAEYCCVIAFQYDTYDFQNNVELIIPGGITLGMQKGTLKKALPDGYNVSDDLYSWYDWDHNISVWVFLDSADRVRSVEYEKTMWE